MSLPSILTIARTVDEPHAHSQVLDQTLMSARPQSSWPLPATQRPDAHLTWTEWVAKLANRLALERLSDHPVHEGETSTRSH